MKKAKTPAWGEGWSIGLRLWVERAGKAILGKGRLELLQAIEETHSISAAARRMGMSYRHAWELVQSINDAAAQPLVDSTTGGAHGGGAELTPQGCWAVATFQAMQEQITRAAALLPALIRGPSAPVLHVAAAVSLQEVIGQLLIDYSLLQPLVGVRTIFGASDEIVDHILGGNPGDVVLTADSPPLDRLEKAGLLEPRSRTMIAGNSLAAVGRTEGRPAPRSLRQLLRQRKLRIALAHLNCPLGSYTQAAMQDADAYDDLARRAVFVDNSRAVLSAVQAGQADVGIVYSSDAARAFECRLLFHLEPNAAAIHYYAALLRRRLDKAPAQALLDFLGSPSAARRFRACGFSIVKPTQRR